MAPRPVGANSNCVVVVYGFSRLGPCAHADVRVLQFSMCRSKALYYCYTPAASKGVELDVHTQVDASRRNRVLRAGQEKKGQHRRPPLDAPRMGNVPSLKLDVMPGDPVTWWLDEVRALRDEYTKASGDQWSFAASEKQLKYVFEKVLPDPSPTKDIVTDTIFPRFVDDTPSNTTDGPTGAGGKFRQARVNVLEVWAAFAIVCLGTIEAKAAFIFDLFDFNRQGSLSHTEVMLLFGTTLSGLTRFARRGDPPDDDTLTAWADHLYDSFHLDYRVRVSKDQVLAYYLVRLAGLCERRGLETCQTYHIFLMVHDCVPDPKARKASLPDEEGWHPPPAQGPGDVG